MILSQILNNKNIHGRWKKAKELERDINLQIEIIEHKKPKGSRMAKVFKHQIRF